MGKIEGVINNKSFR